MLWDKTNFILLPANRSAHAHTLTRVVVYYLAGFNNINFHKNCAMYFIIRILLYFFTLGWTFDMKGWYCVITKNLIFKYIWLSERSIKFLCFSQPSGTVAMWTGIFEFFKQILAGCSRARGFYITFILNCRRLCAGHNFVYIENSFWGVVTS